MKGFRVQEIAIMQSAMKLSIIIHSTRLISFPNPVSDVLHIQPLNNSDEILQFLISDVTGRTILSEKRNFPRENLTIDINTSVLSKGSYLLQIFNSKMEMVMGEVILK